MLPTAHTQTPMQPSRAADDQDRDALQTQLEHRFRHTLRSGQVSPLLHLILRYRQEAAPCTPNT